ncbi:MAG: HAD family hydrolase [Elusimicrobiota bacterium]
MIKNYLQENNILIKKEIFSLLAEVDTIIFDIDGVLVDVSFSYYQTIIDTVQYYFHNIVNMTGRANLVDKQTINHFKMMGGFNDDWELSAAAVLYYLWKMEEYSIKSLEELKNNPPIIDEFINRNLAGGGGLSKLISWVKENSSSPDNIFFLWDKEKIFRIAKEFYAGENHCLRLYNFYPDIVGNDKGNIEKEIILIKPEIIEKLKKHHAGILTGRSKAESRFITEQINQEFWLKPEMVVTSEDNIKKPSPDGLRELLEKSQSKLGLYIGDTMDDLLTVRNLNQQYKKRYCLSALVLGRDFVENKDQREHYLKNDVDILAEDVNQIIELIHRRF